MKPLNFAILKFFTTVNEASVDDVMEALKDRYAHFKAFKKAEIINALMTAETNGLLEQSWFDLDDQDELRVYFRAHDEGIAAINRFIQ